MYNDNTIYYKGKTYEFASESEALRCRLELANQDNTHAYPEGMGGKLASESKNYTYNNIDNDYSYSSYKPKYRNEVKTIEMPFLNKNNIKAQIRQKIKEIEKLLNELEI